MQPLGLAVHWVVRPCARPCGTDLGIAIFGAALGNVLVGGSVDFYLKVQSVFCLLLATFLSRLCRCFSFGVGAKTPCGFARFSIVLAMKFGSGFVKVFLTGLVPFWCRLLRCFCLVAASFFSVFFGALTSPRRIFDNHPGGCFLGSLVFTPSGVVGGWSRFSFVLK